MADGTTLQSATPATAPAGLKVAGRDTGAAGLAQTMGFDGSSRSDTYTSTTTGTAVTVSDYPRKYFGIQVKGTGAAPTSWTVLLEGSLDGVNYSTIVSHSNANPGDGQVLWVGVSPCLYFRSRCSALALGGASNIVVTILGMP